MGSNVLEECAIPVSTSVLKMEVACTHLQYYMVSQPRRQYEMTPMIVGLNPARNMSVVISLPADG
jgi:hypothetical protein